MTGRERASERDDAGGLRGAPRHVPFPRRRRAYRPDVRGKDGASLVEGVRAAVRREVDGGGHRVGTQRGDQRVCPWRSDAGVVVDRERVGGDGGDVGGAWEGQRARCLRGRRRALVVRGDERRRRDEEDGGRGRDTVKHVAKRAHCPLAETGDEAERDDGVVPFASGCAQQLEVSFSLPSPHSSR